MDRFSKCSLCGRPESYGVIGYAGSYTDFHHLSKRCGFCGRLVCRHETCAYTRVFNSGDERYEHKMCLPCARARGVTDHPTARSSFDAVAQPIPSYLTPLYRRPPKNDGPIPKVDRLVTYDPPEVCSDRLQLSLRQAAGVSELVTLLIGAISNDDRATRAFAAWALGISIYRTRDVMLALAKALADKDAEVREYATYGLSQVLRRAEEPVYDGLDGVLEALRIAERDPVQWVAGKASLALKNIDTEVQHHEFLVRRRERRALRSKGGKG